MSVESRIAEVGLVAVLAFVVSAIDIVFTPSAASSLFETFVGIAIALAIVTSLSMVFEFGVLVFRYFLLLLGS